MTSTSIDHLTSRPETIADIISDVAKSEIIPRFQKLAADDIREKKPGDLVTAADEASERALRIALTPLITESGFLGEEMAEQSPNVMSQLAEATPVWIVDPVDGTHNFAHGRTPFTVIVAICVGGVTQAGWIHDPSTGDHVWAVRGNGTWHRDGLGQLHRCQTQAVDLKDALMPAGERLQKRLRTAQQITGIQLPKLVDRYRCTGREYMDIALGRLSVARYGGRLKPWDHAAGCLIVREAGGRADTLSTSLPYEPTEVISSAPVGIVAHEEMWPTFHELALESDKVTS